MRFAVKFEPRCAWVGLFWDRRSDGLHVYMCLVPFLVLHFIAAKRAAAAPPPREGESIEGEARRLCGCSHCKAGRGSRENCMTWYIIESVRAGLEKATEVATINEACHVCGGELLAPDERPNCDSRDCNWDIDHNGFAHSSELIRALLK